MILLNKQMALPRGSLYLLLLTQACWSYKHFQFSIPNGDRVPHPLLDNILWQGVGHNNDAGGGARNPFGLDFKRNSFKWDKCICERDSDGDGKTNGEELGDPECVWEPGMTPFRNSDLSHPGVCEPINSVKCQGINKIDFKETEPFSCPATTAADVSITDLAMPRYEIPAKETNYFCHYFPLDIPLGTSRHVIAYEPIIDNAEVMHHILAFGCTDEQVQNMDTDNINSTFECSGRMECTQVAIAWTVGIKGKCLDDNLGILIGEGGFKALLLQYHWNNQKETSGMFDASGIRMHHTANMREQSAGHVLMGPLNLHLPPGVRNYEQTGRCPSACTKRADNFTITEIMPHMHYFGRGMTVVHERPGEFSHTLLVDNDYSYDSPTTFKLAQPVKFQAGDELKVDCRFTTTSATGPVYFGDGTQEEMCLAVLFIHPFTPRVPTFCRGTAEGTAFCRGNNVDWGSCDISSLRNTAGAWYFKLSRICDVSGVSCNTGCQELINDLFQSEACLAPEQREMVYFFLAQSDDKSLINMFMSCKKQELANDDDAEHDHEHEHELEGSLCASEPDPTDKTCPGATCGSGRSTGVLFIMAAALLVCRRLGWE